MINEILKAALEKISSIIIKKEGNSAFVEVVKKEELLPKEALEVEKMIESLLDGEIQKDENGRNLEK